MKMHQNLSKVHVGIRLLHNKTNVKNKKQRIEDKSCLFTFLGLCEDRWGNERGGSKGLTAEQKRGVCTNLHTLHTSKLYHTNKTCYVPTRVQKNTTACLRRTMNVLWQSVAAIWWLPTFHKTRLVTLVLCHFLPKGDAGELSYCVHRDHLLSPRLFFSPRLSAFVTWNFFRNLRQNFP